MSTRHEELVCEALDAYRKQWILTRQAAEPFWMQIDLTISQLKALITLHARGMLTVSQVAEMLAIGRPSASILIEQLVQLELVVRAEDQEDRRRSLVSLSPRGVDFMERLYHMQHPLTGWMDELADEELEDLAKGLRALGDVIERSNARLLQ